MVWSLDFGGMKMKLLLSWGLYSIKDEWTWTKLVKSVFVLCKKKMYKLKVENSNYKVKGKTIFFFSLFLPGGFGLIILSPEQHLFSFPTRKNSENVYKINNLVQVTTFKTFISPKSPTYVIFLSPNCKFRSFLPFICTVNDLSKDPPYYENTQNEEYFWMWLECLPLLMSGLLRSEVEVCVKNALQPKKKKREIVLVPGDVSFLLVYTL